MQSHDLDPVIRLVDELPTVDASYQSIFIVSAQGKAQPHKGLSRWDKLWLPASASSIYVIGCGGSDRSQAICRGLDCSISDFQSQQRLDLRLDCEVRCIAGKQALVAESLHGGSGPVAVLANKLRDLIEPFIRNRCGGDRSGFIAAFDNYRLDLAQWLREGAAELGLDLTPRLILDGEQQVRTESIGPLNLEICTCDSARRTNIRVELDLVVDHFMTAYLRRDEIATIRRRIPQAITDYCREHLTLNMLHFAIPEMQTGLERYLDQHLLGGTGRKVKRLLVSHDAQKEQAPRALRVEHEIALALQPGDSETVKIRCIAQLTLSDLGTYLHSGITDLRKWVHSELDRIVPRALAHLSYVDLCEKIQSKREQIANEMTLSGARIGYSLAQMVTFTDLVIEALQTAFRLDVKGTFETNQSGSKVEVEITVSTCVHTFRKIREHVNRRADVKALMREAIRQECERLLHTITPEEFYTRFSPPNIDGVAPQRGVGERLEQAIRERLVDGFGAPATETHVRVSQQQDELVSHVNALMNRQRTLPIEVIPYGGGAQVDYEVSFKVTAVADSGWAQFVRMMPNLDQVAEEAERRIVADLREQDVESLCAMPNEGMKAYLQALLPVQIQSVYGVLVEITLVSRGLTGLDNVETATYEVELEERKETLEHAVRAHFGAQRENVEMFGGALQSLREQYKACIQSGMDEEADQIAARMDQLSAKMTKAFAPIRPELASGNGPIKALPKPSPRRLTGTTAGRALSGGIDNGEGSGGAP